MLGGYVKTTSNCQGLSLGWDAGIEVIEDLGGHKSAQVVTGEDEVVRTVVGWTDLFSGRPTAIHAYRAKANGEQGILLCGGNSGLRILANDDEDGDDNPDAAHLPPGWGTPVMWIGNESDLKGFED